MQAANVHVLSDCVPSSACMDLPFSCSVFVCIPTFLKKSVISLTYYISNSSDGQKHFGCTWHFRTAIYFSVSVNLSPLRNHKRRLNFGDTPSEITYRTKLCWTKFTSDKMFVTYQNFHHFLSENMLNSIVLGNFSDKIICRTKLFSDKFCLISYVSVIKILKMLAIFNLHVLVMQLTEQS